MTLETWLLFILVSLAPVVTPGPGILFAITNALRYGAKATIIVGVVNAAGITLLALVVGFGLSALLAASAAAFFILKLVGAAYLIWLGVKIWRDRSAFDVDGERANQPPPIKSLCRQAAAIALTNPKATIALAALLPPFLHADAPLEPQVVILAVTYGALCAINHVAIALLGARLRRFLRSPQRAARVRQATGALFIGFGAALLGGGRP